MPSIPALDDRVELPGVPRGERFIELLASLGVRVEGRHVVDLGSGFGSIAMAAARAGAASVTALDASADRLREVDRRAQGDGLVIHPRQANLLESISPRLRADLAFLIGVVEYAGLWDAQQPVEELQARIFRTAFELLEPSGVLVFGSKNRLWPRFLVRDVHTGAPLENALPRTWANSLSQRRDGTPYRHWIHSPRHWADLIRSAGFRDVRCYYPYFSYQLPVAIVERPSLRIVAGLPARARTEEERTAAVGRLWAPKALLMALGGAIGLPLTHSVIVVASR